MGAVRLGKVVRALGLKGHLGVVGSGGTLAGLKRVTLQRPGETGVERGVLEARPQGRLWALRVDGVEDRAGAESWVGAGILVDREDLGEAGEGRYWWADLEGLPVVTVAGLVVGTVTGLLETGAVDVLVVTGERGEVLVPLAPYVQVDLEGRRVVVDPPEGLLEG